MRVVNMNGYSNNAGWFLMPVMGQPVTRTFVHGMSKKYCLGSDSFFPLMPN